MALFGSKRDVLMFTGVAQEVVNNVVTQQIGYYKCYLPETVANVYGESTAKRFVGPVLLNCLIERGDFTADSTDLGPDARRSVKFRFLKQTLIEANVVPEIGDIIMYNELYYETDNTNENQLILGKDSDYSYSEGLENFGESFSVMLETHLTTPERLGIQKMRL